MPVQDLQIEKVLSKGIVEESYHLPIGGLGKGLLVPVADGMGKRGIAIVTDGWEVIWVHFQIVLVERPHLLLNFTREGIARKQTVFLDSQKITFGIKVYFLCSCGRRCLKLYNRKSSYGFGCRLCQKLDYAIRHLNRRGTFGAVSYYLNRAQKIMEMKAKVRRIVHNGNPTRKALVVIRAIEKWGLAGPVRAKIDFAFQKISTKAGL